MTLIMLLLYKPGGELRCSTNGTVVLLLYKPGVNSGAPLMALSSYSYKPGVNSGAPLMTLVVLLIQTGGELKCSTNGTLRVTLIQTGG